MTASLIAVTAKGRFAATQIDWRVPAMTGPSSISSIAVIRIVLLLHMRVDVPARQFKMGGARGWLA